MKPKKFEVLNLYLIIFKKLALISIDHYGTRYFLIYFQFNLLNTLFYKYIFILIFIFISFSFLTAWWTFCVAALQYYN